MAESRPNVLPGAYVTVEQLLALRFRPLPSKRLRTTRITGAQAGLRLSKQKGRGVDFAEVRQYQPGDDIRSIDWRVTARKNQPHTKIFREERERPALIFVDQSQHMFFGSCQRLKSVAAAELAARIAWQITNSGDRVGGMILDNHGHSIFRPFRTVKATGRLLQHVAQSNQALNRQTPESANATLRQEHLSMALNALIKLRQQRNRIFIISDIAGPLTLWRDMLHRLARNHQVQVIQVTDPLDVQLPPTGVYNIRQNDTEISFFSGDDKIRNRYQDQFRQREAIITEICRHPALSLIQVSTADTDWDSLGWT